MKYKEIYCDSDPEMLNMIDGNLKKAGNNYWKLGKSHFPRTYKASYVNVMMTDPDSGDQKKHIMGPYHEISKYFIIQLLVKLNLLVLMDIMEQQIFLIL